jgi:MFS family permease
MNKPAYKHYLLGILMVVLAFNAVDRLALALVLQDIKADLALSDTQLGLLTGIAFALFYATMGIPIARWADRGNRVTIIALTTALWSAAVALCSLVGSFFQLLLIRIGVAVGEAGCMPPAYSLIADHFTRAERPRAIAIYMLGTPLSGLIGFFMAGWLNEIYGWRTMFVLLGLPGLALAALVCFTLREPRLAKPAATVAGRIGDGSPYQREPVATTQPAQPRLSEVVRVLSTNATFRHLVLCFSLLSLFGSGLWQWQPAFFIRTYGMQTGELGTWLALIQGLGSVLGLIGGGELASRFAANNERLQLKLMGIAYVGSAVTTALIYLSSSRYWAFGFTAICLIAGSLCTAPLYAMIQTLVPQRMRAMSIAVLYLFANLVGLGLGPLLVGALSDALRPMFGNDSLRYALVAMCPGYIWGALHMWLASKSVTRDLRAVQLQEELASAPRVERDVEQTVVGPLQRAHQRRVMS